MLLSKEYRSRQDHFGDKISEDFNAKQFWNVLRTILLPKFYKDQNRYAFPLEMSFWRTDTNNYQMI
jgi:deoxyadenosine/deoxycytidine kinase